MEQFADIRVDRVNIQMEVISSYYKILYLIFDYPHKHYTFKHFEI